ncbi:MAG: cytochrome bc complex cytochrome b subunit [Spirochaetia bacterium]|nr:cytochrome bc complex cytochrome b subunit [Spirochaetia bacterium]
MLAKIKTSVSGWLKESLPVDPEIFKEASAEPIPNHMKKWWFALGGSPAILFGVQLLTGILLAFYYIPDPDSAYDSVAKITNEVSFGWFIRSIHKWSAHFMVFAVIVHLMRVFFTGAFRKPRELNWMIGVGLMITTMMFGFTGYSLIYEQISYWAAVVGAEVAASVPFIGEDIARFMKGGESVGANTLTRFYVLHIGVLPTVIFMLLGLHFYLIRTIGVTELEFKVDKNKEKKTFPFFPDHIYTETIVALVITIILVFMALTFPAQMGDRANPFQTPDHIKPEWFFYPMFRLLKLLSELGAILGTTVFVLLLLFWPFVDRLFIKKNPNSNATIWFGIAGVTILVAFTIWEALV